jgi:hypothetical protein
MSALKAKADINTSLTAAMRIAVSASKIESQPLALCPNSQTGDTSLRSIVLDFYRRGSRPRRRKADAKHRGTRSACRSASTLARKLCQPPPIGS